MARRRGSTLTMEDLSFALANPIGAAILAVMGWSLVAFRMANRPEASDLNGLQSPIAGLSQALEPLTLWPAFALAGVGSIALAIQLISWASCAMLDKHEESIWAEYGAFVESSDIARVQFAAKMVAVTTVVGLLSVGAFAVCTEVKWLKAITLFGPVPLFASTLWWLVQTYRLHKTAQQGQIAQVLALKKNPPPVVESRPAQAVTPQKSISPVDLLLEMPLSETDHLVTRLGRIRVTRCVNGSLRLYWPPNTTLMERAKAIVSGRADYKRDHNAWFVYKAFERGVLLDLAQL